MNTKEQRPWGCYEILYKNYDYKIKEIALLAKQRLSYQRHLQRDEHWCIIKGVAKVTLESNIYYLEEGDTITIPKKAWHRIANTTDDKLIFIEIQKGDYLEEDDIERKEDDYGRIP